MCEYVQWKNQFLTMLVRLNYGKFSSLLISPISSLYVVWGKDHCILHSWSIFLKILHPLLPLPDLIVLQDQNLDFLLLSLYLYAVAYGAAYFLGLCCWLAIIFSGHTAHKMALR